jgi:NADPH-dependent glutamate synthase beta chain and related oxidoreductases
MELGAADSSGRRTAQAVAGSEFDIPVNIVIKALGQQKRRSFFEKISGIELDKAGRVVVNQQMQTGNPKYFAGGDCVNGGREAVDASQMGKLAAIGLHKSLTGEQVTFAGAINPAVNE